MTRAIPLMALLLISGSSAHVEHGPVQGMENRTLGMYVLLADDTTPYDSTRAWQPALHKYQQEGTNVLYFTFINPDDLPAVPPAFPALAQTRGTTAAGAVPPNTTILFAIGGQAYSEKPNPWKFLETKDSAEAMAAEVAKWPALYGCDGIDMDIETGAGAAASAVTNIVFFAAKLQELVPGFIFTQPVFGSPSSVPAANTVIAAGFNKTWPGSVSSYSFGSVSRVGIMIYSGEGALAYVDNYANGCTAHCSEWYCPLPACVPLAAMVLGAGGALPSSTIAALATDIMEGALGGIMVWYASVLDAATGQTALVYGPADDASDDAHQAAQPAWQAALRTLRG